MNIIDFNLFPGGAKHCITLSYDDGQLFDVRLAEIFRENGLVCTFHLNSGAMQRESIVKPADVPEVYRGHEVSCHMVNHPFPTRIPDMSVLEEIIEDRKALEAACGYVVRGMSYPYGDYDERTIRLCRTAGMEYARTTRSTGQFGVPSDFMQWHPTCHHKGGIMDKLEEFYTPHRYNHMRLLYVWGHSYEFNTDDNWNLIEEFAKAAAHRPDTWYASNIGIVDYVNALHALRFSADRTAVYNPTATETWISVNGAPVSVAPGKTVAF